MSVEDGGEEGLVGDEGVGMGDRRWGGGVLTLKSISTRPISLEDPHEWCVQTEHDPGVSTTHHKSP